MLGVAIVLFLIAAVFGIVLIIAVLQDKPVLLSALFLHGTFAAIALLILFCYLLVSGISGLFITSLGILTVAALLGASLVFIDIKNKTVLKLVAVLHPFIAIAGLIMLIIDVLP
ncbi:hypothetical protein [Legionella quateirensis]|uniref:Transmembrane protein n=1 Tax=Legionella quateirensis TaxID=45072 RepID=A0A378KXB2_9GAMM|nr:hypothetical protein [Legionella quateirensis]KTD46205.1 hypothetical protein Lqua_2308 [Legionella quateirensis]STY19026.1 Uncharacterised protein [Legionella quateirensis]